MGHVATAYDPRETAGIEPLLTIAQAAKVLAVTPRTIYRLVEGGHLVATRVGSRVRFEPVELRRYVEGGRSSP
jgi:excisionase family DNA binding protein